MAIESIAKTLGSGSGIDTTALVQSLVDAQFEAKTTTLAARQEKLTAQITAAATHKSNMTGFANALASLARGGSLATQPTTSNSGIVTVTRQSGANLSSLNARVEVRQLAAPQTASAAPVTDKDAAVGQGTLTLRFGTATVADGAMTGFVPGSGDSIDIAIGADNSSLQGIADAINAANAGVTASILTDADGARLVLKGASGAARAFTLTATETPGQEGLSALDIGVGATGTTIGSTAADAIVAVDGVALKRDSNTITDLVPGVRLDLVSAQPGTVVTLGKSLPTEELMLTVQDVVDTYNQVLTALNTDLDPVAGALKSDVAARELKRQLQELSITALLPASEAGGPRTLAEIGVRTNRDGTLSLDAATLTRTLVDYPQAVEAMFATPNGSTRTNNGLVAAINGISSDASSTVRGLGASELTYSSAKSKLSLDQEKALAAAENLRTRMTRQFASMDAKVAAYKSTMTFLENQVDAWNKRD
ncbi:MAG: flagellar hook protein [Alphaproteobacteria bacterium HGW-Alphaproteobacteria-16]|nr:MAG: flagellar hook protein [Alphaproteobacteria bacterium HGW-Alphaproteobacteria-16]